MAVIVAALVLGVAVLGMIVVSSLWSPEVDDACAPGYRSCLDDAEGVVARVDCRIELYHCRREGPAHWGESDATGPLPGSS